MGDFSVVPSFTLLCCFPCAADRRFRQKPIKIEMKYGEITQINQYLIRVLSVFSFYYAAYPEQSAYREDNQLIIVFWPVKRWGLQQEGAFELLKHSGTKGNSLHDCKYLFSLALFMATFKQGRKLIHRIQKWFLMMFFLSLEILDTGVCIFSIVE